MSNFVKLTDDVLNVGEVTDLVSDSSTGAISLFVGTTRDNFDNKKVVRLEYEAYDSMAEKNISDLCQKLRSKWPLHNIAIWHRLGEVRPREASVVIAVTSEHRKASLEAVQFAIDALKSSVPIWKKEIYEDGSEWKANKECPWTQKASEQPAVRKVDPSLVQITASEDEVDSRIEAFIARKRKEIDCANVQEFCSRSSNDDSAEFSCARTDSIVVRRTGTSSHLRKTNAVNAWGPQTKDPAAPTTKTEKVVKQEAEAELPTGLGERLNQLEDHLFGANRPVPKDVYDRLKNLEERVLHLEGLSPEYFSVAQNLSKTSRHDDVANDDVVRSKENDDEVMASLSNINKRIQELRSSLVNPSQLPGIKMEF